MDKSVKLNYIEHAIKLPNLTRLEMAQFHGMVMEMSLQELDSLPNEMITQIYNILYRYSTDHPYITLLYVLYKCRNPRYKNQINKQEMEIYNLYKKLEMF